MIKNRSNGITDAGAPLVVDAFTRKVTVPATERVIGVVGDHCSEQVRFSLPRHIDNHDMTTCTESYVAWRNVDGEEGTDELTITESNDDRIVFGWVVRDAITTAKGLVSFSLHFECWEKDEQTKKEKLVYKWGTHTCTECEILDAINTRTGDYKAIYIDGDALVFADYTPVHDNTLDLTSCVVPEGTKDINEAGKHDVGRYAYVDVKAAYEEPTITIADGVVTAEANGLTAEAKLEAPDVYLENEYARAKANGVEGKPLLIGKQFKRTWVTLTAPSLVEGLLFPVVLEYIDVQGEGKDLYLEKRELELKNPIIPPHELYCLQGSRLRFRWFSEAWKPVLQISGTTTKLNTIHEEELGVKYESIYIGDSALNIEVFADLQITELNGETGG